MKLSVVTTLYQSSRYIEQFVARAADVARKFADYDYEIIIVNDGSPDDSLELAIALGQTNPQLVIVDLARNFGHHHALMAGMEQAAGDFVFLIDSDLEEAPELLQPFAEDMQQAPCDIIYGVQTARKGRWLERVSGAIFYRIFNILTRLDLPANPLTARLMTRRFVDALLLHREREIFLAGLIHITGFTQRTLPVEKLCRGATSYNFRRRLSLLVNSVTSFSNAPLVMIFYIGMVIVVLAALYTCLLLVNWLFFAKPLMGWTSVMASIWLLGGMIISFIGMIGIYLAKTFAEVKQRPSYIIRQIYRNET
jgi:putative glycosyltransferase